MGIIQIIHVFKRIVYLFSIISVTACSGTRHVPHQISPDYVDSIRFGTLPKSLLIESRLTTYGMVASLFKEHYKETVITDRALIKQYVSMINRLRPVRNKKRQDRGANLRTTSILHTRNGDVYICFGHSDTTLYEGILMRDRKELFVFLDTLLYDPYPEEYWQSEQERIIENGIWVEGPNGDLIML